MARLSSKHLYPTESPPRLPFTFSVSSFNLTEKKGRGRGQNLSLLVQNQAEVGELQVQGQRLSEILSQNKMEKEGVGIYLSNVT